MPCWDSKCVASSYCFVTSGILSVVHRQMMQSYRAANGLTFSDLLDLTPASIELAWTRRDELRGIEMSAALIGSLAWFLLAVPVAQTAWVLSRGGRRKVGAHVMLASVATAGALIEFLALLLSMGMNNISIWMSRRFNLSDWTEAGGDGTGWRVLEMISLVTDGMLLWVDAFESLALFGIVAVFFFSIGTEPRHRLVSEAKEQSADGSASDVARVTVQPTFRRRFAYYGLFVGVLALLDFILDVLRFVDWRSFGFPALLLQVTVRVIFLPIWLLCLARQLPVATERFEEEQRRQDMLMQATAT